MSWQEQQAFVKQALGPQLKAANLSTKIYAFDHNYNYDNIADQADYPVKIYNDAGAASFSPERRTIIMVGIRLNLSIFIINAQIRNWYLQKHLLGNGMMDAILKNV